MKTWKKLLIIGPKLFSQVWPGCPNQPRIDFHIMNMSQDSSVYWSVAAGWQRWRPQRESQFDWIKKVENYWRGADRRLRRHQAPNAPRLATFSHSAQAALHALGRNLMFILVTFIARLKRLLLLTPIENSKRWLSKIHSQVCFFKNDANHTG